MKQIACQIIIEDRTAVMPFDLHEEDGVYSIRVGDDSNGEPLYLELDANLIKRVPDGRPEYTYGEPLSLKRGQRQD